MKPAVCSVRSVAFVGIMVLACTLPACRQTPVDFDPFRSARDPKWEAIDNSDSETDPHSRIYNFRLIRRGFSKYTVWGTVGVDASFHSNIWTYSLKGDRVGWVLMKNDVVERAIILDSNGNCVEVIAGPQATTRENETKP